MYNDKSDSAATLRNSVFRLTGLFNDKRDEAARCRLFGSSSGRVRISLITIGGDRGNNTLLIRGGDGGVIVTGRIKKRRVSAGDDSSGD